MGNTSCFLTKYSTPYLFNYINFYKINNPLYGKFPIPICYEMSNPSHPHYKISNPLYGKFPTPIRYEMSNPSTLITK